jgi:hypothetical protein
MGMNGDAIYGFAEDWLPSDFAGLAHPEDDDENFERWLSSAPATALERLLDGLLDGPGELPAPGSPAHRWA